MSQAFSHDPVMADEVVDLFRPIPPGILVTPPWAAADTPRPCCQRIPGLKVLGIDRDPVAVEAATKALAPFGNRAIVRQSRFDVMAHVIDEVQPSWVGQPADRGVSGALFDLGVSSHQLDVAERGLLLPAGCRPRHADGPHHGPYGR